MALRPCTGCGHCCRTRPCTPSVRAFGPQALCPALQEVGGRYWCQLVLEEQAHQPVHRPISHYIGIGQGCTFKKEVP